VAGSGDFALYPEETEMPVTAMGDDDTGLDLGEFNFNDFEAELQNSDPSTYTALSSTFNPAVENPFSSPMFIPDIGHDTSAHFDWNMNSGADYTAFNAQLATPASSAANHSLHSHSRNPSLSLVSPIMPQRIPNLSPNGQGNVMLYGSDTNQHLPADEGFAEFASNAGHSGDFPLYEASHRAGNVGSSISSLNTRHEQMFPPLTGQYMSGEDSMTWTSQNMGMFNDDLMNMDMGMGHHQ